MYPDGRGKNKSLLDLCVMHENRTGTELLLSLGADITSSTLQLAKIRGGRSSSSLRGGDLEGLLRSYMPFTSMAAEEEDKVCTELNAAKAAINEAPLSLLQAFVALPSYHVNSPVPDPEAPQYLAPLLYLASRVGHAPAVQVLCTVPYLPQETI